MIQDVTHPNAMTRHNTRHSRLSCPEQTFRVLHDPTGGRGQGHGPEVIYGDAVLVPTEHTGTGNVWTHVETQGRSLVVRTREGRVDVL